MKFGRRTQTEAEIPTASMADIAFLLIVFFMVTTVFSATKGLELSLPSEDKQENAPAETEEAVFIHVYTDYIMVDCKQMEPEEILPYLEPKLTVDQQKHVILYTDPEAPYKRMVKIYDVLAEAKDVFKDGVNQNPWPFEVKNISIPTQSEVVEYTNLFGKNPFETHCQE